MIQRGIITNSQGDLYTVAVSGIPTLPMPALSSACRIKIDFDAQAVEVQPLQVGDAVAVFLADPSGSTGLILGLWGEDDTWIS